jgi:hypothetical protein
MLLCATIPASVHLMSTGNGDSPTSAAQKTRQDRAKQAIDYLRQVKHSEFCKGSCKSHLCVQTYRILTHTNSCSDVGCPFPGCFTTKTLIAHCRSASSIFNASTQSNPNEISDGQGIFYYNSNDEDSPTFNRIPFQGLNHTDGKVREDRKKTFSFSDVAQASFDDDDAMNRPKQRSKSVPNVSSHELGLLKQL